MGLQVANAGSFFAEVDHLEEQAERVGDPGGFGGCQAGNPAPFGADGRRVVVLANGLGELPNLLDMIEDPIASLFADDRAQPCCQDSDFSFELCIHASGRPL